MIGLRDQYGNLEEDKHFMFLLAIYPRFLGRPNRSLVPIPTELLRPAIHTSHNVLVQIVI